MSKRLIIYRHAKSDWSADYNGDHERPLAKRGVKAAKKLGKLLAKYKQVPQFVLSSTALRAVQTAKLSIENGSWECVFETSRDLYDLGYVEIYKLLTTQPDKFSTLMIVSHEPKCSLLCSYLIGGGEITFPTAAMARIDFVVESWSELSPGGGSLKWLLNPSFFAN